MSEAKQTPRCLTCKHFQREALFENDHLCAHPDLEQSHRDWTQFQPPSIDFGCTLHERKA